jgi:endonuclease YncB( thermonuclease family)
VSLRHGARPCRRIEVKAPAPLRFARALALLLFALPFLAAPSAPAAELYGKVIAVADGDTITVLDEAHATHKVRLAGIDAPERRQAYGDRARQHLSELVYARTVAVSWSKRDRYGRIVGLVRIGAVDAGLEQVRSGWAWHYKQYRAEQKPADRLRYARAEDEARERRAGLWSEPDPTPPWEYRGARHARLGAVPALQ